MFLFTYSTFRAESCLIIPKDVWGHYRGCSLFFWRPPREVKTHYIYIYASFLAWSPLYSIVLEMFSLNDAILSPLLVGNNRVLGSPSPFSFNVILELQKSWGFISIRVLEYYTPIWFSICFEFQMGDEYCYSWAAPTHSQKFSQ